MELRDKSVQDNEIQVSIERKRIIVKRIDSARSVDKN